MNSNRFSLKDIVVGQAVDHVWQVTVILPFLTLVKNRISVV